MKSQAGVSKQFLSNFRQVGVIKPFSRDLPSKNYHPFHPLSSPSQSTTSALVSKEKERRKEEKEIIVSRNKEEEEKPSLTVIKNEEKEKKLKLNEIVDSDNATFPVASSTKFDEKSFENISKNMSDKKVTVEAAPPAQTEPVFVSRAAAVRTPTASSQEKPESNLRDVKLKHVSIAQQQQQQQDKPETIKIVDSKPPMLLLKSRPAVGRKPDAQPNSMVFNFVNSTKVVTHIENDGLDMSKRRSKSNSVRLFFQILGLTL